MEDCLQFKRVMLLPLFPNCGHILQMRCVRNKKKHICSECILGPQWVHAASIVDPYLQGSRNVDPDPHRSEKLDPYTDPHICKVKNWIWIRNTGAGNELICAEICADCLPM